MTTEQWERENQDTLMEYFIDGNSSVPQVLQLPNLRSQDAESAEKP